MKFAAITAPLALLLLPVAVSADDATYDNFYDNGSTSLNNVACSNGANGLVTKGFTTFDSLPTFPNIGGAHAVSGWNSPECGSCWKLTYTDGTGSSTSITYTAIDTSGPDFNIAEPAMQTLAGNTGIQEGKITVQAYPLPASACGM